MDGSVESWDGFSDWGCGDVMGVEVERKMVLQYLYSLGRDEGKWSGGWNGLTLRLCCSL